MPDRKSVDIRVFESADALSAAAARYALEIIKQAETAAGCATVCLAGGSTPGPVYRQMADLSASAGIDWERVYFFWGDERCVPPDHEKSNYRMAHEKLLSNLGVPSANVFRMQGELEPQTAASNYENLLQSFKTDQPGGEGEDREFAFDLVLLGLGEDAHTASIFPGTSAVHEAERWVMAHYVDKLSDWRLTLTPVVLNAAANVAFVVAGAKKSRAVKAVLEDEGSAADSPAKIIRPVDGALVYFLDSAAASGLSL